MTGGPWLDSIAVGSATVWRRCRLPNRPCTAEGARSSRRAPLKSMARAVTPRGHRRRGPEGRRRGRRPSSHHWRAVLLQHPSAAALTSSPVLTPAPQRTMMSALMSLTSRTVSRTMPGSALVTETSPPITRGLDGNHCGCQPCQSLLPPRPLRTHRFRCVRRVDQQALDVVEVHFVFGVVDQRSRSPAVHCRFRFEPSGEGTLTDRIEMLGPEFEMRVGLGQSVEVEGRDGQHKPDAFAVDGGQRVDQGRRCVAGCRRVGFAVHDHQRFAHGGANPA